MKEFAEQLDHITGALRDPEYLYLLIEPVFIYGIGLGILAFLLAFFMKENKTQLGALIVIVVSALAILPYLNARAKAADRIEKVYQYEAPSRARGFETNTEDRAGKQWIFLLLAGTAGAALLVGPRRNKLGTGLAMSSVALGVWVMTFSVWMHYQESLVYHPNLKTSSSPVEAKVREKERAHARAGEDARIASRPEEPAANAGTSSTPARVVIPLDVSTTQQ